MILTGKCKEDFLKHEDVEENWFNEEYIELFEYALVIEWFDSVGIYINVLLDETNNKKFKYLVTDINIRHLHCWTQGTKKESRKEATKQAIIKANEIYNEKRNII